MARPLPSSSVDADVLTNWLSTTHNNDDESAKKIVLDQLIRANSRDETFQTVLKRLDNMAKEEEFLQNEVEEYLERLNIAEEEQEETQLESVETEVVDEDELDELKATVEALEHELNEVMLNDIDLDNLESTDIATLEAKLLHIEDARILWQAKIGDEISRISTQRTEQEKKLDILTKSDALNESFFIWHEGAFGTINGLRLGCLPDEIVEWNEINAAFGYAALLLDSLAKEVGFDFFVWRVLPRGSQSLMVNVQNSSQTLNLFCNSSWLWKTSFNAGISAFADCVDELGDFARREDPSVILPHRVDRSTIGGLSVHYSNSPEWTKAMKYLLTDLKWIIVWVARRRHLAMITTDAKKS